MYPWSDKNQFEFSSNKIHYTQKSIYTDKLRKLTKLNEQFLTPQHNYKVSYWPHISCQGTLCGPDENSREKKSDPRILIYKEK